ncbi:unnamed protein product [Diamesa serratosioi]
MLSSNLLVIGKSVHGSSGGACEHVKDFFDSINVTINPSENLSGGICGGKCCDNRTETDVLSKSIKVFEGLIKHHTRSLKGLWDSTANIYKDHVLELSRQSENKTLILFSQVYRRMSPLSRTPILELYKSIRSHISSPKPLYDDELESIIEKFFINLFPLAYHHAVHSAQTDGEDVTMRDFHIDYKNCLTHTYEDLQPFGDIPMKISRSLVQSVSAANVLLRALERGTDVLLSTEDIPIDTLSLQCQQGLVRMNYCAACKGHNYHHARPCFGYCSNVMRGCLTQYLGALDQDWSSFSEAIQRLMTLVRSKDGIETVIKALDGKLSEAIMAAMENGPELEKKVKKACGTPSLSHADKSPSSFDQFAPTSGEQDGGPSLEGKQNTPTHHGSKWASPPDAELLKFMAEVDKTKEFSLPITVNFCQDERYQKEDKNCWTGYHMGDYKHNIISMHAQKYNPEVPTTQQDRDEQPTSKIHLLNDQLLNLKQMVLKPITHLSRLDSDKMLSDMADGSSGDYDEPYDNQEYDESDMSGSGHMYETPIVSAETPGITAGEPKASAGSRISFVSSFVLLATIIVISFKQC